ncbi:polycystin-2-like [Dermacentor silvarum]|uniref:polycystin-2-like n=1 Tax=Dermacentor silvarum TaxID=543639 RepID=UPI0018993C6E|nr:polycystin-2-like [Dermacentor silvarum]
MSNPASNLTDSSRPNSGRRPRSSVRPTSAGRPAWNTAQLTREESRDLEAFGANDQFEIVDDSEVVTVPEQKGCFASCLRGLRGLWSTRQLGGAKADREWYIRTTLRELLIYVVFLVVLCILTFGMMSPTMYYQTKVMSDLFLDSTYKDNTSNLRGSTSLDNFWSFVEDVMLGALYWENWYNNQSTLADDRNILYENRLLGSPRIRQLRVRNDSCNVHSDFKKAITQCFDNYSPHFEDKGSFGLMNGTAWTYHTEKELKGADHWGLLSSYSGAGYYADLGITKEAATQVMADLKENLWIGRATRAVFLDFTVYNANVNLFCVIKLVFEFPATGGMIPSWSFRTVKLLRYVSVSDYFIMACEFFFTLFILYYIVEEVLEIKSNRTSYFKSIWNILDILVILISLVCIGFSIYRTVMVNKLLAGLLDKPDEFADFGRLGFYQTQFNNAVALAVFFAWIKVFKYISFNKTMTQLSSTLSRCSKDVAGFSIMFFIVFFAFAQLGYLLFGTQIQGFSSFVNAVFTLLRLILGDFDFEEMEAANRVLGPIYFLSYVFFVFFVLLNMFLAIINDTYAEVKSEISQQKNEFEIVDYFKKGYNNILGKLGKRDQIVDIQNALKMADTNHDNKLTFDEVRKTLKAQNFSDMEIEMLFSKYDVDGNRELNEQETKEMMAHLEGQKVLLDEEIQREKTSGNDNAGGGGGSGGGGDGGVSSDEFNILTRRVDRMEHSIGSIVSKIDAVLVKMEAMEKAKANRRDTMSKILDTISENEGLDEKGKRQQMEKLVREELQHWDSDASLHTPRRERSNTP